MVVFLRYRTFSRYFENREFSIFDHVVTSLKRPYRLRFLDVYAISTKCIKKQVRSDVCQRSHTKIHN